MRVIEFVGPPGAGKSTQIEALIARCQAKGLTAVTTSDRGRIERTHTPPADRLMFHVVVASQAVECYHAHRQSAQPPDVLFLDRGWNDVRIWSEFDCGRGSISSQERLALQTVFSHYYKLVERTVYMTVEPELSLERHKGRKQLAADDLAMQPDFLKGLHKAYDTHWYKLHRPHRFDGRLPQERIAAELSLLLKL